MPSNIDPTKPTAGNALTSDVRANFQHAKTEIEALQEGTGLADGAVTDAKIGVRTPDQSVTAVTGSGTLSQIINWFANIIKGISGETNWFDQPGTTLKSHVANVSNPHSTTAAQVGFTDALTEKTTPVDADLIPILDSAGTPAYVLKKLTWANLKATLLDYFSTIFSVSFDNVWGYLGECLIDQQATPGTPYTIVAGAAPAYTIDGWLVSCTGANITAQQVSLSGTVNGFQKALRLNGAALVTNVTVYVRCPSYDAAHFTSRASRLLFWARNSLSLPITWTLSYANAVDNFAAVTTISSGSVNATDTMTKFNNAIASSANAGNGLQLSLSIGALTSGTADYVGIDQIYSASDRAYPHVNEVSILLRCYRFYYYVSGYKLGYTNSATLLYSGVIPFLVPMHVVPTLVAGSSYTVGAGAAGTPAIAAGAGLDATIDNVVMTNSGAGWNINTPVAFTGAFTARL